MLPHYKYFFTHGKLSEELVEQLTLNGIYMDWWEEHELWIACHPCNVEAYKVFKDLGVDKYIFDSWWED
jgi:hypothetical protein